MNITTKEDMKKVLCESSYLEWYQRFNPNFLDIVKKINEECGTTTPNTSHKRLSSSTHEYLWVIHDIKVEVVYTKEKLTTTLSLNHAKIAWVSFNAPLNLHIDFLSSYLIGLRSIWRDVNSQDLF